MKAKRAALICRVAPIAAAGLCLSGCHSLLLDPQGPIGASEKTILINAVEIMLCIVVPTIVATFAFAWWFRASNTRATYRPDWAYSGKIETVTWSIPILVILFLGGITWIGAHDLDPARPIASPNKEINVQVVSLDWKWLFIYPDQGVASVNELTVPAGAPIHFSLTSSSVMNAFFIPQLGGMIYTMNAMTTELNLQADQPGDYLGESSHYSGDGFSGMHFGMHAVPTGDFDTWLAHARANGPSLDADAYRKLSEQSLNVKPFTYRSVAADLFRDIVTQKLPPGPGPRAGTPSPDVFPRSEF